ncbi:MAG: Trk system potassium transporter TrkA [Clostridia bacterium]
MRIIIVGCGKIGMTIIKQLSNEGHDITVIDTNSQKVHSASDTYDVLGFVGNGASHGVQIEAGIERADMLIAVTGSDELNILCCLIAKKAGNCNTIARVRNPVYNEEIKFIKDELGLSLTINPEYEAAMEIAKILRLPSAIKVDTFAKGKVELLKYKITKDSQLQDISLIEIQTKYKTDVLVCAVERDNKVLIPRGDFRFHQGDVIHMIASHINIIKLFKAIGIESKRVQTATIVGGGIITYYLAKELNKIGIKVKIIETNLEKCEQLSELFPEAIIINADATNQEVLIEEGIDNAESFISLTGIDEANIFLSLFAQSRSKAKVITKINRISYDDIIHAFDLGSIIYPKYITADHIVRFVRATQNSMGSNVETLYKIIEGKAEALEFVIKEKFDFVGKKIEELNIHEDAIIASIQHNGKIIIPRGQDVINVNDHVIVVTTATGISDIKDILG